MTDTEKTSGPLAFDASFPPDERFVSTAADLAAKLATAAGCSEGVAEDVRLAVDAAFRLALSGDRPDGLDIELSLRTSGASLDADVTCGGETLLRCSHPRSG